MKQEKKRSLNPKVKGTLDKKVKTAQQELETYLKSNKLDPSKDHSKDKKHGAKIRELIAKVNVAREQVKDAAPKEIGKAERTEIRAKEKAEKAKNQKAAKYEYPKVDGREMTSSEKKKYRVKMRSSQKGDKKEAVAKPEKSAKVSGKVAEAKPTGKAKEVVTGKKPIKTGKVVKKTTKKED